MPSTERFRARPMGACLEPCPLREITSFVEDSGRSRKSVVKNLNHIFLIEQAILSGGQQPKQSNSSDETSLFRPPIERGEGNLNSLRHRVFALKWMPPAPNEKRNKDRMNRIYRIKSFGGCLSR